MKPIEFKLDPDMDAYSALDLKLPKALRRGMRIVGMHRDMDLNHRITKVEGTVVYLRRVHRPELTIDVFGLSDGIVDGRLAVFPARSSRQKRFAGNRRRTR